MRNTRAWILKSALGFGCLCAAPSWASTIASTSSITNGNLTFSNFNVSTVGGTNAAGSINGATFGLNTVTAPDATQLDVTTEGNGIQFASTVDVSSGACPILPSPGPPTLCVQAKNQSLMVTITYLVTSLTDFSSVDLYGTLHSHANNTAAAAFLDICGTGLSPVCASAPTGVSQLGTVTGGNVSANGPISTAATPTLNGSMYQVWVRETIYLTTANGSGSDAEFFAQGPVSAAPEPATLGMVGLSLLGLGGLHSRRKKRG